MSMQKVAKIAFHKNKLLNQYIVTALKSNKSGLQNTATKVNWIGRDYDTENNTVLILTNIIFSL